MICTMCKEQKEVFAVCSHLLELFYNGKYEELLKHMNGYYLDCGLTNKHLYLIEEINEAFNNKSPYFIIKSISDGLFSLDAPFFKIDEKGRCISFNTDTLSKELEELRRQMHMKVENELIAKGKSILEEEQ